MSAHREIFNEIYEKNKWGYGSGLGSVPQYTAPYRIFLSNFMKSNGIKSVLDVGCGDWQISSLIDWSDVNYIGMDVSSVVLTNTSRFAADNIRFIEGDAVHDELPRADLLILKDVLQHWSNTDILRFLPKMRQFPRALVTNGFDAAALALTNQDISSGGYRPVDLKASPFNMHGTDVFWYDGGDPKVITLFQGD